MSTHREEPAAHGPTPDADPQPDPQARAHNRAFVRWLRILAGASALVSLLTLWTVEGTELRHDLQLAAPSRARPGEPIALRALIFRDVDAPRGPELATAATRVRLLDEKGRELAATSLAATAVQTLDGALQLPKGRAGSFVLEAKARFEESDLECRRRIEVSDDAPALPSYGREAGPLQHLSIGSVHASGEAPSPFVPRVVGGACVPAEACRVLIWMGEPAAELTARIDAGGEISRTAQPAHATSGIVELQVVLHGPDAVLTLEARRGGGIVAERAVRLPVGLGEVALTSATSLVSRDAIEVAFVPPPGRAHVTLDSFARGHWTGTAVVGAEHGRGTYRVPEGSSSLGVFRLQARTDRLSAEGAGARVFYVRSPGEDDVAALTHLAALARDEAALANEPTAAWATRLPDFTRDDVQQSAAFLLAGFEQRRVPVPVPVSGRPAQLGRLAHTRALFRFGVSGALVLSAVVMGLSVARRGIEAADEAQSILDLARLEGDNESTGPLPGEVFGARMRVLLLALAVAAAFLAAALLIAAKPLWF